MWFLVPVELLQYLFRVLSRKEIELAPPRGENILSHKYKKDLGTS